MDMMIRSEVHNIDCVEYMRTLPDKYFQLSIADPPYGINAPNMKMGEHGGYESTATRCRKGRLNSGAGKLKNRLLNQSDCSWDREPPKKEFFDQLFRVSLNVIIWGGNYFPLPPSRCIICWDKEQPWENFSQIELAWTSFDMPAKMFRMGSQSSRIAAYRLGFRYVGCELDTEYFRQGCERFDRECLRIEKVGNTTITQLKLF